MSIEFHRGDLPDNVKFTGSVAIDTETMGLNPHRDRLCLVQLSSGNGSAHLVQIKQGPIKAPNLKALLEDHHLIKIFHYARFDVATLNKHLNTRVRSIYCTKIASRLVRTYTDRHGLKDLCAELIGVDLSKKQQSSDWGADELSQEQLDYAASDVLYLHKLVNRLNVMLERSGRMELAKSCFDFIPSRAELDLLGWDDQDIFSHS
ncbi:MAG: ribonuclease H-like domain-containing protein [Emcibacter sp.]|nr:ribonuclease H-like domain-containing protein [Emcibacter sp.]